MARALFEHIFERAEEARETEQAPPVELGEQPLLGLVEVDQHPRRDRDDHARHDIDQEQPVPAQRAGEIATHRRPDRRRQRRGQADDRRHDGAPARRKDRERRGKHRRDHAAADKTLQRAIDDHLIDVRRRGAERAGGREARGGDSEQHARREDPRQHARQRDHDDFGDEIRRLHPGDLVRAGAEAGLDFAQRARHHLDVEDGHEHAHDHEEEADDPPDRHRFFLQLGNRAIHRHVGHADLPELERCFSSAAPCAYPPRPPRSDQRAAYRSPAHRPAARSAPARAAPPW